MSTHGGIALIQRAISYKDQPAIVDAGHTYSYAQLLEASARVAHGLLAAKSDAADLASERVCFMVAPGFDHVAVQWGIFRAGGVAVPLCVSHPAPELAHVLDDAKPYAIVADREHAPKLTQLAEARGLQLLAPESLRASPLPAARPNAPHAPQMLDAAQPSRTGASAHNPTARVGESRRELPLTADTRLLRDAEAQDRAAEVTEPVDGMPLMAALPEIAGERHALLIYTSGTTGKPKAAITTHAIFTAQLSSIVEAWELTPSDRILHVLPLHHLHGVLNALGSLLYAGGCVEFMPRFDPLAALQRFRQAPALTLFMGVPTIYAKLVQTAETSLSADERTDLHAKLSRLRVMISGSAALPVSLLKQFEALSGHVLLERYGMTELGMALGNPLHGERRPGSVGVPFPGVEARIVDEQGRALPDETQGELQIRGPNVFAGYFGRPEASAQSFTADGFFRTGDVAIRERGYFRLLGRESVDIIKTGGFKVSALEIEESLREHPAIAEVAVIGLPDPEWGERVAAHVVLQPGAELDLEQLRSFGKERLAPYKVPSRLRCEPALPRNVMGKVHKPTLLASWSAAGPTPD
ncbi:MAG TPA: acyl-CoA synthetase [Polyangiales bacterium]|nr:acyl-CoA synthetase [Polyangiales bacterium]